MRKIRRKPVKELKQQPATKNKTKYKYHDYDVVQAAIDRTNYVLDNFDAVWYAFSGGKDSLAMIEVAKRVHKERGFPKPNVFFTDEELIPDDVIDLVCKHAESGDYNFKYFAPTMIKRKFLMGKQENYCSFDPDRKWVRQPPDYAIQMRHTRDMDQWQINEAYFPEYRNTGEHVAIMLGIRSEESLMRLNSVSSLPMDGSPNWIAKPKRKSFLTYNAKPVYDWSEIDIFKYFYDHNISYAKIYDFQIWTGALLRVSTPLHEMSSSELPKLKKMYPVFYAQLVSIFPDVEAHCRYWTDYDTKDVIYQYPHTFDGIRKFIKDRWPDDKHVTEWTTKYVNECETIRLGQEKKGINKDICYGFPVMWIFEQVLKGKWGKEGAVQIKPEKFKYIYKEYEYDYEN